MTVWRGFLLTLLALLLWGFGIEPGWLQERQLAVASPRWTLPPLKVAVASDWHVGAPHAGLDMVRQAVAQINAGQPDLILLPGDFVIQGVLGGTPVAGEEIAQALGHLRAPLGVYATLGNHDWWLDKGKIAGQLAKVGITVLENQAVALSHQGRPFWLVGIGDDMTQHSAPQQALAKVPPEVPLIAMMHDPATAPQLPARTAVAVAGHTHGGQVRLPLIGALITPGRAPREHAYGWIPGQSVPTYVTSGIGTSILPVRFNCPPETVMISLSAKVLP